MNILGIMPAYNEKYLLPLKAEFCFEQGISLYVLDNMSTDGSYEMLGDLPAVVGYSRIDTHGAFHLTAIQEEIGRLMDQIHPDWVVYQSVDLFPVLRHLTLREAIEEAQRQDKTVLEVPGVINMIRIGPEVDYRDFSNPARYFYRAKIGRSVSLQFIAKYRPGMRFYGDSLERKNKQVMVADGVNINLGNIKTPAEREETYQRRKTAWMMGMRRQFGKHFQRMHDKGWKWAVSETSDIRESEFAWAWEKLAVTFDGIYQERVEE